MNLFKPTHPSDGFIGLNKLIRKIHGIYNTCLSMITSIMKAISSA